MSESLSPSAQYLSFFLAGEEYALGILRAREILEYDTITRVPGVPVWIRGVFNLRGSVVPVIDLATKLGMPPATPTRWSCIVVVEVKLDGERVVLGMLVDSIGQVMELEAKDVAPPPPFGTPVHLDYLAGMGPSDGGRKFVLLLDIDKVLSDQEVRSAAALPDTLAKTSAEASAPSPPEGGTEDVSEVSA
jgi:purine-binding chemotaxis protein CheW